MQKLNKGRFTSLKPYLSLGDLYIYFIFRSAFEWDFGGFLSANRSDTIPLNECWHLQNNHPWQK